MFNKDLYKLPFHNEDLSKYKFLITGGAGFIGSNIAFYLQEKYPECNIIILNRIYINILKSIITIIFQ